jgi:hypothetical protein
MYFLWTHKIYLDLSRKKKEEKKLLNGPISVFLDNFYPLLIVVQTTEMDPHVKKTWNGRQLST